MDSHHTHTEVEGSNNNSKTIHNYNDYAYNYQMNHSNKTSGGSNLTKSSYKQKPQKPKAKGKRRHRNVNKEQASPSFTKPLLSSPAAAPMSMSTSLMVVTPEDTATSSAIASKMAVATSVVSQQLLEDTVENNNSNTMSNNKPLSSTTVSTTTTTTTMGTNSHSATTTTTTDNNESTASNSSVVSHDPSHEHDQHSHDPSYETPTTHASSLAAANSNSNTGTSTTSACVSPTNHHDGTAIALDYSSHACVCLQEENLEGALTWYQRALIVYQTEAAEAKDPPLGIVDTCNAAATLHNMGAVYNALQQADAALQCYHDAEQLYRECQERLDPPTAMTLAELQDQETVCLTALIAETLHHRAAIYETSVWDSVAALECHEACTELLEKEQALVLTDTTTDTTKLSVTMVDDVFFQHECLKEVQLQWLIASYTSLAKLYRQSDTPQDGLQALLAWKQLLEDHIATLVPLSSLSSSSSSSNNDNNNDSSDSTTQWHQSLADCWKQLAEFYFGQEQIAEGMDALNTAMDIQQRVVQDEAEAFARVLTPELLSTMNQMGAAKEQRGHYEEALVCYEKILLLVSRYLGKDHWQVAETLVKIGRVMECQGNAAGGLDLYHAAHTIYQAAVKNESQLQLQMQQSHSSATANADAYALQQDKNKSKNETTTSNSNSNNSTGYNDDGDIAFSTRAATESVVRIANVLMGQKRWQEAVDFLRELPQAKMSWLQDEQQDHSNSNSTTTTIPTSNNSNDKSKNTTAAAAAAAATTTTPEEAQPSVDQAIVFRELGRAYMGMGALAKAKQCLLESARRLEGTDHEEDVFELLMHVEFCQKQERKAALATAKNRLRSRSRSSSRARSRHNSHHSQHHSSSGNSSSDNMEERGRITKDAVAAVLSPQTLLTQPQQPNNNNTSSSSNHSASVSPKPVSPTPMEEAKSTIDYNMDDAMPATPPHLQHSTSLLSLGASPARSVNSISSSPETSSPRRYNLNTSTNTTTNTLDMPDHQEEIEVQRVGSDDNQDHHDNHDGDSDKDEDKDVPSEDPPMMPLDGNDDDDFSGSGSTASSMPPPPPTTDDTVAAAAEGDDDEGVKKANVREEEEEEKKEEEEEEDDDDDDEKSLGSLDTQSYVETYSTGKHSTTTSTTGESKPRALTPLPTDTSLVPADMDKSLDDTMRHDANNPSMQLKDSFQVQRAKDIILKRVMQETELLGAVSSKEDNFIDDGQSESDVVSSVLVGLDIDIDMPSSSPPSRDGASLAGSGTGGVKRTYALADMKVAKSASTEKPFDESTLSQTSSRGTKPFDETTLSQTSSRESSNEPFQGAPGGLDAAALGQLTKNPMSFKERLMMQHFDDEQHPSQIANSLSDLTSTYAQSSSSSLNEAPHMKSSGYLPPLLQSQDEADENPFKTLPPPPPPPASTSPPLQIETRSNSTSPRQKAGGPTSNDGVIQSSVDKPAQSTKGSSFGGFSMGFAVSTPPNKALSTSLPLSPRSNDQRSPIFFDDGHDGYQATEDDDDDASSDPFEGYEDFDADDESGSEASPSYSGDSESEEGYTRFAKEDFSSEDGDPVGGDDVAGQDLQDTVGAYRPPKEEAVLRKHKHKIIIYDDSRQTIQARDAQADAKGTRGSPLAFPVSGSTLGALAAEILAAPQRDASPTSEVHQSDEASPSHSTSTPSPGKTQPKKNQGSDITKSSPGNRIVRALSNSIRLRRKSKPTLKQSDRFEALQTDVEAEGESDDRAGPAIQNASQPKTNNPVDEADKTDHAVEEVEGEDTLGRPIQFVSMQSPSDDADAVSQITFTLDDYNSKSRGSKTGNQQWWGQLGQWVPDFHQAVEAAEGFLSAKAIHAQMKSQPLDFDSENEEDTNDDLIVRDSSTLPVAASASRTEAVVACSPIPNAFFTSSIDTTSKRRDSATKIAPVTLEQSVSISKLPPSSPKANVTPVRGAEIVSTSPNKDGIATGDIATDIKQHQKLLAQYELEALNDDEANHKVANTLFRLSILFLQSEQVEEALKATNEALRIQKYLGDVADAARSLHLLADIFVRKGEYESALSCYAEVQETERELYGYIHEESASTLNRIASVLARQSKFGQAMEKHQEALRILKECHGEELRHPLVSQTLIHIGAVYYRERNSLATLRTNSADYSTFIEVGMLEVIGRAHEDRGSYKMAISFFEEKLQCLNEKHNEGVGNLEDIAQALNSLGMLSCRAGIFMEAIDYYDRALEVQKQIGCDKMHIATARVLTATVQFHLGYFQKALRLLQDALDELRAEAGEDHETVAATWFQIGVVQVALCNYDDGMDALEEALRIQIKLLGKVHPATLRTRREIGNMYAIYASELDAAFAQFRDILTTQRRIHGHKHPNIACTLQSIGIAYARKGDFANAIKMLEECYYMRIDFLGADHPLQATTLHEIAEIHRKRQRFRKAAHICDAVLEIRRESLSERHIDVARALASKASCLVATGDYTGAMKCIHEALPMAEQAVGERHPAVADILVQLGEIHLRKCHFDEAKEWINKALAIYQSSNLDEDHPSLKEAIALMERVDRDEMLCV